MPKQYTWKNKNSTFFRLLRTLGFDSLNTLVQEFGGEVIRVPKTNILMLLRRNMSIFKDYNEGYPVPKIAAKWNLSRARVHKIIRDMKDAGTDT